MNKKDETWIKRSEKPTDRIHFDFKRFFEETGITLDGIAETLDYTISGTKKMVLRGTIKRKSLQKLNDKYKTDASIFEYTKKKKEK